jgi:hypothetical protein
VKLADPLAPDPPDLDLVVVVVVDFEEPFVEAAPEVERNAIEPTPIAIAATRLSLVANRPGRCDLMRMGQKLSGVSVTMLH